MIAYARLCSNRLEILRYDGDRAYSISTRHNVSPREKFRGLFLFARFLCPFISVKLSPCTPIQVLPVRRSVSCKTASRRGPGQPRRRWLLHTATTLPRLIPVPLLLHLPALSLLRFPWGWYYYWETKTGNMRDVKMASETLTYTPPETRTAIILLKGGVIYQERLLTVVNNQEGLLTVPESSICIIKQLWQP